MLFLGTEDLSFVAILLSIIDICEISQGETFVKLSNIVTTFFNPNEA